MIDAEKIGKYFYDDSFTVCKIVSYTIDGEFIKVYKEVLQTGYIERSLLDIIDNKRIKTVLYNSQPEFVNKITFDKSIIYNRFGDYFKYIGVKTLSIDGIEAFRHIFKNVISGDILEATYSRWCNDFKPSNISEKDILEKKHKKKLRDTLLKQYKKISKNKTKLIGEIISQYKKGEIDFDLLKYIIYEPHGYNEVNGNLLIHGHEEIITIDMVNFSEISRIITR